MPIILEIKPDLICSICLKPITDIKRAHVFWRSRESGYPMIAVVHAQRCDTPDLWTHYATWENLENFLEREQEMRLYFNSKIFQGEFTREDVKEGLERIFVSVPDAYFDVSDDDLRQWYENSMI